MNNNPLQRVSELIRGVIELLWNRPEGLSAREVIAHLPEIVNLTGHEIGLSPKSHTPRYERTIRIATLPLVKAGWLLKTEKGQWLLTEDGRHACRRFPSSQDLFLEAVRLSEALRQHTPDILVSLDLIQEKAWETIANFIRGKT